MRARARTLALLAALVLVPDAGAATLEQIGTFGSPTHITSPPGDSTRLFVVERGGTVRIVRDGTTLPQPFIDVGGRITAGGEQGLLSIAFPPDHASSGLFYLYLTDATQDIVVEEGRRSADPDVADAGYRREVLRVAHREYGNHNGGQLQFGPDGLLYAGTGDGGGGGDPHGNAQNDGSRLGKLLRIDPRVPGAQPEVFAKGLRNPWRFSFDRQTSDLTIGDVGQNAVEEIDFASAPGGQGFNYGWDRFEGNDVYDPAVQISGPVVAPVITHSHDSGWCSITGGYVIRDPGVPDLAGKYVYGDYCKAEVWAATLPDAPDNANTGLRVPALSSFGEDACGRVYAVSLDGPVYRFATSTPCAGPGPAPAPAPAPAADTTPPGLRVTATRRQRVLRTGRFRLTVTCDERCAATVSARAIDRRAGRLRRTLAAGRVTLVVRVPRAVRRAMARSLRRRASLTLVVSVRVADAAGNARSARVRVNVVRR